MRLGYEAVLLGGGRIFEGGRIFGLIFWRLLYAHS